MMSKGFFFRINRWWKTYENHPEIYLIKTRWLPNQGSFVVKLVNFHMVGAQSMPFFVTTKVIAFQFPKYSVLILFFKILNWLTHSRFSIWKQYSRKSDCSLCPSFKLLWVSCYISFQFLYENESEYEYTIVFSPFYPQKVIVTVSHFILIIKCIYWKSFYGNSIFRFIWIRLGKYILSYSVYDLLSLFPNCFYYFSVLHFCLLFFDRVRLWFICLMICWNTNKYT